MISFKLPYSSSLNGTTITTPKMWFSMVLAVSADYWLVCWLKKWPSYPLRLRAIVVRGGKQGDLEKRKLAKKRFGAWPVQRQHHCRQRTPKHSLLTVTSFKVIYANSLKRLITPVITSTTHSLLITQVYGVTAKGWANTPSSKGQAKYC